MGTIRRRNFLQKVIGGSGWLLGGFGRLGAWDAAHPGAHAADLEMEYRWQIGPFVRPTNGQPILRPNREATFRDPITHELVQWESGSVVTAGAIASRNKLYVLFRAEDATGRAIGQYTSRVGLAESSDGESFSPLPHPVLYPEAGRWEKYEWPGGCEDPRIVQSDDGTFVLTLTLWNRKVPRLGVATSKDLLHWQHHGSAFRRAYGGRFEGLWSKAGAIITRKAGEQIIVARVAGKYWMYWNTGTHTALAYSYDLINWVPVLDRAGQPLLVLPRNNPGYFDSLLTEPGPPALLTVDGIVLFYNGVSDGQITSGPRIPANQGSAGQALFAGDNPAGLLCRPRRPFFWPQEPWEKTGQYKPGVTFIEGLAWYRNKWFLFYGGADTAVGMAVARG